MEWVILYRAVTMLWVVIVNREKAESQRSHSGVTAESHRRSNIEEFGKVPRQNDMGLLISHNIYATNKAVSTVPSQRAMVSLV